MNAIFFKNYITFLWMLSKKISNNITLYMSFYFYFKCFNILPIQTKNRPNKISHHPWLRTCCLCLELSSTEAYVHGVLSICAHSSGVSMWWEWIISWHSGATSIEIENLTLEFYNYLGATEGVTSSLVNLL